MRTYPLHMILALAVTGCASIPENTSQVQKPSTFTLQADADTPAQPGPARLPIIAAAPVGLPIQAVSTSGASHSTGPLAGIITKVAAGPAMLPIVAVPAKSTWSLTTGHTVGQELQAWGEIAGWRVIWSMPKDWSVPANTTFSGDFKTAASDVIKTLAANGALVRAQFYDGNKTMIVTGPGVIPQ